MGCCFTLIRTFKLYLYMILNKNFCLRIHCKISNKNETFHGRNQSSRTMAGLEVAMCRELQKNDFKSLLLLFLLLPSTILTSSVTVDTPTGHAIGSVLNCNNKRMHVFLGIPCVHAPTGDVIGSVVNYNNKRLHVFWGIPFAEPPVGNLRFKKTVPVKPWTSPLRAHHLPPACVQYTPDNYPWDDQDPYQSEDCLYLNIWAPEFSNSREKKAVMFWIFSGGFATGSGRMPLYDGKVLAAKGDVIVVTINYRLSTLGFFTSETEEAPGNVGLYDILEALKWVNENIAAFGGDTKRITVFGNSAGSVASGLLCVSPLSKGLFQRAILESACPAYSINDHRSENLELGQNLAEAVGCADQSITLKGNPDEVTECLRSKDAKDLVTTTFHLVTNFPAVTFFTIIGDDFLPTNPQQAIREGNIHDVDFMIGVTQDEGSYLVSNYFIDVFGPLGELNPCINKTFGESLLRQYLEDNDFPDPEAVIEHYLSGVNEDDYDAIRKQVYLAIGDEFFNCPSKYFAEKYSEKNNSTYRYYWNHRRKNTRWAEWMAVAHFEEVEFVFGRPFDFMSEYTNYTQEEEELSLEVVTDWTNFAKNGETSKKWQKFTRSNPYIQVFQTPGNQATLLEYQEENCEFFRPYFGF